MRKIILTLGFVIALFSFVFGEPQSIDEKTAGLKKFPGYFNFYWDNNKGKIWLEVDKFDSEFLYVNSVAGGLGSFEIGLDRNSMGRARVVEFTRIGPKILLKQKNYSFRSSHEDYYVSKAVEDAFAQSVIWGFKIEAEQDNKVLVDASSFLLRDANNVTRYFRRRNQGNYSLDISRSAIGLPGTKNFPKNTEIEAILTFVSSNPGNLVRQVAPDSGSVTLRVRHSLVQLPDDGFELRMFDPRSSFLTMQYMDFASPIGKPLIKKLLLRHRLEKKDPSAKTSDPVKPIIYYVERGVPEPIRSAILEGASWWNEAFEAIGYRNAFQVKVLPEGVDPLDIRYNVISWVYRLNRGWSYAGSVRDPRTGEYIKAAIVLASQRMQQDFLIAEGLIADYDKGEKDSPEMQELVLARIRQLACHEVGHILGLDHNFSSSVNNRASVMDYPHPLIKIKDDGSLDVSEAYATGVGEWDKIAIAYGYQDFPEGVDEKKELQAIMDQAISQNLHYHGNSDTVPDSSPHPFAHRWDNGDHPVDELERIIKVRDLALKHFSEKKIRFGAPMATLEEVLVPLYMFHRYQIVAASKMLGGLYYSHSLRGDSHKPPKIVPPSEQRRALDSLLKTLQPENLAFEDRILKMIPPRPPGYRQTPELFPGRTGLTFDPLGAAETVANLTIQLLLNHERAARMMEHNSRNKDNPGFNEVLDKLISFAWKSRNRSGYLAAIQQVVNNVLLYHLMSLAIEEEAAPHVKSVVWLKLEELKKWFEQQLDTAKDKNLKAHYFYAMSQINIFQKDPDRVKLTPPFPPTKSVHNPPLGGY